MHKMPPRDRWIYISAALGFWIPYGMCFATFVLYWREERGLNYGEIGILTALFSLAMIVLQMPTGYVADRFGRKYAYLAATAAGGAAMWLQVTFATFYAFFLSQAVFAVSRAFYDGTMQAWAAERLETQSTENLSWVSKIAEQSFGIGTIIGGIGAGFIAWIAGSFAAPQWVAGGMLFTAAALGAILITKSPSPKRVQIPRMIYATVRESPLLRALLLFTFFLCAAVGSVIVYWNLYFKPFFEDTAGMSDALITHLGLSASAAGRIAAILERGYAGAFMALLALAWMLGSTAAFRSTKRGLSGVRIYALCIGGGCAGFIALVCGAGSVLLPLAGFMLIYFISAGIRTVESRYVHANTDERIRTSALSGFSMAAYMGSGIGQLATGYIAVRASFAWAWGGAAVIFMLILPVLLRRIRRFDPES